MAWPSPNPKRTRGRDAPCTLPTAHPAPTPADRVTPAERHTPASVPWRVTCGTNGFRVSLMCRSLLCKVQATGELGCRPATCPCGLVSLSRSLGDPSPRCALLLRMAVDCGWAGARTCAIAHPTAPNQSALESKERPAVVCSSLDATPGGWIGRRAHVMYSKVCRPSVFGRPKDTAVHQLARRALAAGLWVMRGC
jgi:hypothetical protein